VTIQDRNTLEQIDAAIKRWREFRSHWQYRTLQALGADPFMSLRISLMSHLLEAIEAACPDGSRYLDEAQAALAAHGLGSIEAGDALAEILGALRDGLQVKRGRT